MLNQETRQRFQDLVHNQRFLGSVYISDRKYIHPSGKECPIFAVSVDIHGDGYNIFSLLAELFPDMKLTNVRPYECDQGDYLTFGSMADGAIEEATVNVWANYGRKEKTPAVTGAEKLALSHSSTEMVEREA